MPLTARALPYAAALTFLGLGACRDEPAAIAVPDPAPPAFLSAAEPLPYADPAPVSWYGPERGYQWAERAHGLQQAVYEAPPDYGFDYGGVEPWVWETADEWAMYAEPWDDGWRYYYYEPEAAYPYFIYDGSYGYGYDAAGVLVALFDADGDYLPARYFYEAAPRAGRYYVRGRDLRNAARQARRMRVAERVWEERAPRLHASARPWLAAAERDEDWRRWRERHGDRERRRFIREERRRDALRLAALREDRAFQRAIEDRRFEPRGDRRAEAALRQAQREAQRERRREQRRAASERRIAQAYVPPPGFEDRRAERREDRRADRARQARAERREEDRRAEQQRQRRAQAQAQAERREAARAQRQARAEDRGRREARQVAETRRNEARAAQARERRQTAEARRNEARAAGERRQRELAQARRNEARAAEARERRQAAQSRRNEQTRAAREARAAQDRGRREAARAADQQAREAAFRDRGGGPRAERPQRQRAEGGGGRPERGGGAERGGGRGGDKRD